MVAGSQIPGFLRLTVTNIETQALNGGDQGHQNIRNGKLVERQGHKVTGLSPIILGDDRRTASCS
jgi:hypothetical protein